MYAYPVKCELCGETVLGTIEFEEEKSDDFVLLQNRCDACTESLQGQE